MRVLASYRAEDFAGPSSCQDRDELAAIGWLPGVDRHGPPAYLDPIEDDRSRPASEDPRGVAILRHPEAMLRDDPELWAVVDLWRAGVLRDLTAEKYEQLSNFAAEARMVILAAESRERQREFDRIRKSGGG